MRALAKVRIQKFLDMCESSIANRGFHPSFGALPTIPLSACYDYKLVSANNPDKIIFVGEALVGNEAVDQLTKFDRALRDFSSASGVGKGRGIDGMLVTKWDTVDDKVRFLFFSPCSCSNSNYFQPPVQRV